MLKPSEDFLGTSEYEGIIYVIQIIEHAFLAIFIYVSSDLFWKILPWHHRPRIGILELLNWVSN